MPGPAFRVGEDVALHTIEREDLEFVARLRTDPDLRHGMTLTRPESDIELESWFEAHVSATDTDDEGAQFLVVPRDADDGEDAGGDASSDAERDGGSDEAADGDQPSPQPVGYVSLFDIERPAGTGEIAVTIAPEHRGQGYATDAVRELVAYGIEELRLTKVRALALVTNDASRAVLENVGFRVGEVRRELKRVDGEHVDVIAHSLLADDWFDRSDTTRGLPDRPPGATAAERGHTNPFATDADGTVGGERRPDAGDGANADNGGER
ncbi:GNAT family N-acetyltransferase [Haloglomus salinum]|uniref:GNAT family N-acetyltransferase n=1 Tax=Haloglomus salinum TaxID=2962673 RepID=UPI0020C9F9FA|nr:GNAT family protein [Haloglomus salinum]